MRGESEAPPPRSALSGGEPPPTQRGAHQPTPMGSIDTKKGHLSRPSDVPIKYRSGKLRVIRTHGNDFGWGGPCLSPSPKIMGKHSVVHPVGPKFEEHNSVSTLNKSVSINVGDDPYDSGTVIGSLIYQEIFEKTIKFWTDLICQTVSSAKLYDNQIKASQNLVSSSVAA